MPGHQDPGGRRDGQADGQELLRRHRAGHDRDGGQRPDHRRRHAAGGAGLLGGRRQRLVWRRPARPGPGGRLEGGLRHLPGRLGRRRNAGAGRHRRRRPHRPGSLLHRPDQPQGAAVGRRPARRRRRHRAAGLQRHPCQRPEPGPQAGRAAAQRLPDRDRAGPELWRGPARADRAVLARDRGAVEGRHRAALLRQHHRPRLAQAAAPPERPDLPHPHGAAEDGRAGLHPAAGWPGRPRGLLDAQHGRRLRDLRQGRRRRAHRADRARLRH
mmetsp:Transcript_30657/g.72028  ORF Transcript_30657/g.72028 Transcript_30657/m.72028 type:complete len:270 (+) Transcript_30657:994-1803(+)